MPLFSQDKTTTMLGMSYSQKEQVRVILTSFRRVYDFADVKDWDQNKRKSFL
jgi:hypothetical protein